MAHLTGNAASFFAKNQDLKGRFNSLKMQTMNLNQPHKITDNTGKERDRNMGLSVHKTYNNKGPINNFTRNCDTHYKVAYLLVDRDLEGQNILDLAGKRVDGLHNTIGTDLKFQKKKFYDGLDEHKQLEAFKRVKKLESQKMNREIWQEQIAMRKQRDTAAAYEDMFAPVGSPVTI